ncbi:MAG: hypothetical protein NDJ94_07710, partial [Vicinamibacteria bacterium]|nr:hypothetical protein [Vicinamibacteria bacterium]
ELTEQLDAADAPAIGLLPSGGQMPPGAVPSFEAQTLQDHGFVVVIGEQVARSRPSREAPVAQVFEPLSQLRVTDTVVSDDGLRTWLAVQPADSKGGAPTAFVEVRSGRAAPPLELGTPIREFLVPPPTEGLSALVDAQVLEARLAETRAEGYTITWISVSSAATPDETERERRADRVLHATYLLKQWGVDGQRITVTERIGTENDPAVRVRLFGHR